MIRYEINAKLTKEEYETLIKATNIIHYILSMFDMAYESGVSQDLYDKIISNTRFDTINIE